MFLIEQNFEKEKLFDAFNVKVVANNQISYKYLFNNSTNYVSVSVCKVFMNFFISEYSQ